MDSNLLLNKYLQVETTSIVLIGMFNPAIFQPYWFALKGLVREEEANNGQIDFLSTEITKFQIGDWLSVEVRKDRCEFKTSKAPYFEPLKDLVCSTFSILNETPIAAVGINNIFDVTLCDSETYYNFGDKLAPLSNWKDIVNEPRLEEIRIVENNHDQEGGRIKRILIKESDKAYRINFGVNIDVNNHFNISRGTTGKEVSELIANNFQKCHTESMTILDKILTITIK